MCRTVLFLCTGNYYRSRFAEALFNHLANQRGIHWRAESRGLATELGIYNVGPLSSHAADALRTRGIDPGPSPRPPLQCSQQDLENAALIIALKEAEHRPLLMARHPGWEDRCCYWTIHDLDAATPEQAMSELESLIHRLIDALTESDSPDQP